MKNRSVMNYAVSRVPQVSAPRSVFNRSSGHKTTMDAGYLVPFYVDEILPGDNMSLQATILMRLLSPAVRPFMDNLWVDTFWFFCPNRLVWSNFQKFMGEQATPASSISFTVPTITGPNVAAGGIPVGHLFDYMGLPVGALSGGGATTGITFDNLFGRAYNLTWNQWFRAETIQDSVVVDLDDGPDTFADYNLLRRGKRFDYFTSALPYLQKGTAVPIALGTSAPVIGTGDLIPRLKNATDPATNFIGSPGSNLANYDSNQTVATSMKWHETKLIADLSSAVGPVVNTLRQSVALQQFLENDARGGTYYQEIIKNHFGVTSDDARLQRVELLATYSAPFKINPVASTTVSAVPTDSLASLGAFGTGVINGQGFSKGFTEHGMIIGLVSVRADLTYQQGMDRMWSRQTRYDFFWPDLANLGEQSILNREIYANLADGTGAAQKDGTFGYIPRNEEYRSKNSKITGSLRSFGPSGNLDVWHLSQEFSSQPTLNTTFIQDDPPMDRVILVPSEPHFIMDAYFQVKHARVIPTFGVPGLNKL